MELFPRTRNSWIRRLPAGVKLCVALGVIAGSLACPPEYVVWLLVPAGLLVLTALSAKISLRELLVRLLVLEPLVVMMAAFTLLGPHGVERFVWIVSRSTLSVFVMIVLASTTSSSALLRFLKKCRVPMLLITTLFLMCRYLGLIVEESHRMNNARKGRTFTTKKWWHWRTLSMLGGQLFLRSSQRAERVYQAMISRGWQ